ncbi:MAG: hypothetical protein J5J06_15525 [Phycisphaerae bacterium]|nr:hypothetical protein [Phycisphaerae bacterium]
MNPDGRYVQQGALRGAGTDRAAYLNAEHMLDRYGVAYVCRHPELLLGIVPSVGLAYRAHASGRLARNDTPLPQTDGTRYMPPYDHEDLIARLTRAYGKLDQVFAPPRSRQ